MSLKYYEITNSIRKPNPKDSYYEDYAAILDSSFDNAPNVVYDEIEYEVTYGKKDFKTISRVRVDTVLAYNTGIILGDDYKTLIFPPEFDVTPYYGMKFRWNGDYWLVINTNSYASLVNSAEIRRCNNVLRFFGNDGEKIYEPCIMDYTLCFANNEDTMTITVGNGEQKVWFQRNDNTSIIKANDRFLFGPSNQRVAFRLYGGGAKNYLNGLTFDDNSPTLSEFYLDHYEINPLFDDLENGFANAYLSEVSIKIKNENDLSINLEDRIKLEAIVTKGNVIQPDVELEWNSSRSDIIDIEDGCAVPKSLGSSIIFAKIPNTKIYSKIKINVVDSEIEDKYELIVEPDIDYVLQNNSKKFSVYLYKNGIIQDNDVVFMDMSKGIPNNKYYITVENSNEFILYNTGMYMDNPVIVKCVCGEYEKEIKIKLRGLY